MNANRRVLVLGIDGGSWDVLRPLAERGVMPYLGRILEVAAVGDLRTTMPPITAAAWTSFATGVNPGRHGLVDFVYFPDHGYKVAVASSRDVKAPRVWDMVSAQDRTVGILGVPMTYPPSPLNGFMISGLMTPPGSRDYAYPLELVDELDSALGTFVTNAGEGVVPRNIERFTQRLLVDVELRVKAMEYLLSKHRPAFSMFVFQCLDGIQHRFLRLLDDDSPFYSPEDSAEHQSALHAVYRAVDDGIRRLCGVVSDDTLVLLMSDHGFGPLYGFIHLNTWLLQRGYLVLRRDALTRLRHLLFRLGFTPETAHQWSQRLGLDLRYKVNRGQAFAALRKVFLSFDNVDWSRTRAYSLGHIGQLYINLRGRQPQGVVDPGEAYESLRDELGENLLAMKHPATGEALFAHVHRSEALYTGSQMRSMPDLLLEPSGFRHVAFGESEFASNHAVGRPFGHSGHHRMSGILAALGPGVHAGKAVHGASIVDLAPTILYALGLRIPAGLDGRVLTELFDERHLERHRPEYTEQPVADAAPNVQAYSAEDEAALRQRLRRLGYIA